MPRSIGALSTSLYHGSEHNTGSFMKFPRMLEAPKATSHVKTPTRSDGPGSRKHGRFSIAGSLQPACKFGVHGTRLANREVVIDAFGCPDSNVCLLGHATQQPCERKNQRQAGVAMFAAPSNSPQLQDVARYGKGPARDQATAATDRATPGFTVVYSLAS